MLLDDGQAAPGLPVCDHYCGIESRMRKSLALQAAMMEEFGACVFDVTLDCEDGAPVGNEAAHAQMVADLLNATAQRVAGVARRVAVRVHPVRHPSFKRDVVTLVGQAGGQLCHIMLPKVESVADVERAAAFVDAVENLGLPLHVLLESPLAVQRAGEIAAHPRVQSVSFGLMDFVSAHRGAIAESAMTAHGQFDHPLVWRAKLEIAAACHAHGKVPSHCVVTEFKDAAALKAAATQAAARLGYMRMWSIHPDQIRPIIEAFAPSAEQIEQAVEILRAAQAADWAPVSHHGTLHDRASYRYYWQVLQRAHRTAAAGHPALPAEIRQTWFAPPSDTPPAPSGFF